MNPEDFQIKYWAGDNDFSHQTYKAERGIKKKLFIVFSFVGILAAVPVLIFTLSNLQKGDFTKVSVSNPPVFQTLTSGIEAQNSANEKRVEVINNDSYWKISRRVCGSGKYYLSIKDQNGEKALHKGDFVTVTCSSSQKALSSLDKPL